MSAIGAKGLELNLRQPSFEKQDCVQCQRRVSFREDETISLRILRSRVVEQVPE